MADLKISGSGFSGNFGFLNRPYLAEDPGNRQSGLTKVAQEGRYRWGSRIFRMKFREIFFQKKFQNKFPKKLAVYISGSKQ